MTPDGQMRQVRVVCTVCSFEKVVEKSGEKPATVIVEHGRETGHKLCTEAIGDAKP